MTIRIKTYNLEQLNTLLNSDISFEIDANAEISVRIPEKALEIELKKQMYQEDISDTLAGKKKLETKGEEPVEKTPIDCKLTIAENHETTLGEYFYHSKNDDGTADIRISLSDGRGGFNKFDKEQILFLLEITGGALVETPRVEAPEEDLGEIGIVKPDLGDSTIKRGEA